MGKAPTTGKTLVTEYRMSMHYGICHGPVDKLLQISVGDKPIWNGEATSGDITIHSPELFGGGKKEGGVSGRMYILGGEPTQLLTSELATKLGGTPSTVPGFRGYLSVFFVGLLGSRPGFMWGANSPYIKPAAFKVRRSPKGFYPEKAMIGDDANPMHIIYECLTNTVWGMGGSAAQIDQANFMEAADTLFAEGMGLSLMWSGQSTIESFVQEILDHIEATFFTNPRTGLFNIKLIRPDFDVETLFHITDDNAIIGKFQRKGWGETINEINATWTNPINEEEENVTVHDLGNIAAQGDIVPSSRNYYGVRNANLALRMAQRDLTAAAFPLASCEVQIDRSAWAQVPGNAVKLSSLEHGLSELVMRVGGLNYGRKGNPKITVTLIEDVFALPDNPYVEAPPSQWQDPAVEPQPLAYSRFTDVTYYAAARAFGDEAAENVAYPQSYVGVLGAQAVPGTMSFVTLAEGTDVTGVVDFRSVGEFPPAGRGTLAFSMGPQVTSILPAFSTIFGNIGLEVGAFVMLGSGGDNTSELCLIESVSGGEATIRRGILDTIPRAWPAGTVAWLFRPVSLVYDQTARAAGQTASYKLLPRTTLGLLSPLVAPVQTYTVTDRLHRPFRPANVKVNGILFGADFIDYAADGLVITWSNRNRIAETSQIAAWSDAGVTPEAGQTTRVTIYNEDNSILEQVDNIAGSSFTATFPAASITGSLIRYVVESKRGGLWSLQSITKTILVP